MSDAVNAIIQSDETKAKLDTMGTFGEGTTPEACDAFLVAETTKWGKVSATRVSRWTEKACAGLA